MTQVVAFVHEERGAYGISFPDFPGCIAGGDTLENVVRRGADALAFHVEGMIEDGLDLPDLRDLDAILRDRALAADRKGALLVSVAVELPSKVERINISMEKRLLDRIDRAAEEAGENRSLWLANAARARLLGRSARKGRTVAVTGVGERKQEGYVARAKRPAER